MRVLVSDMVATGENDDKGIWQRRRAQRDNGEDGAAID